MSKCQGDLLVDLVMSKLLNFSFNFKSIVFTVRNSSCRKVMFSQASVILSGGVHGRETECVWRGGGMYGRRGMHGRGMRDRGHAWCGVCAWQWACVVGGVHGRGVCWAGETATAADGTRPTGMHSCILQNDIVECGILRSNQLHWKL